MILPPETNDIEAARTKQAEAQQRQQLLVRSSARLHRMIREAREHPIGLIKLLFRDQHGQPPVINEIHESFTNAVLEFRCVLFEAPRGSTKTTTALVTFLWHISRNPNLRCKLLCENDDYANLRLAVIRKWIEHDELYRLAFPDIKIDPARGDTKTEFCLLRPINDPNPTVMARGILSAGTGARADLILADDVCGMRNTLSNPALKLQVIEKIKNDWLPTLARDGRFWSLFTPWASDDANAYLKQVAKGWKHIFHAHGKPDDIFYSIFPEVTPRAMLEEAREIDGPLGYSRSYLCKIVGGETQAIHAHMIQSYSEQELAPILPHCLCYLSIDPAKGQVSPRNKNPDAHGIAIALVPPLVAAVDTGAEVDQEEAPEQETKKAPSKKALPKDFKIFIPEVFEVRCPTRFLIELVQQLISTWAPVEAILVESQGLTQLVEWLSQIPNLPLVIPIPATRSKLLRIQGITPLLDVPESSQPSHLLRRPNVLFHPRVASPLKPEPFFIPIPSGQLECKRTFYSQAVSFPATTHDDALDTVVQLLAWCSQQHMPKAYSPGKITVESSIIEF